jgi:hypothetical protein
LHLLRSILHWWAAYMAVHIMKYLQAVLLPSSKFTLCIYQLSLAAHTGFRMLTLLAAFLPAAPCS